MAWKQVLGELATASRKNMNKLLQALPENITTKSNTVKTADLRIDVHQDSKDPNKAVAKIQANSQAKDQAVKDFIKSGNKGGGHKGTHKNIAEIPFDRSSFDIDDFEKKIKDSR
ncbi:hypothetical protein BKA66DRAFT_576433 [Pyrenochaeta sp. MPI-SDFR-AT-0127]|nr:hypothetical protein BKA66DRAFT_576433 [Pyrenochaeta sp. MPI-SDFR-AT-0127]